MKRDRIELIRDRLNDQDDLNAYRKKVHRLRCAVAGDISGLMFGRPQKVNEKEPLKPYLDAQGFYDINVVDIEEGRSNRLLQAIKTIKFQVAHENPVIEFENCDTKTAVLMQSYLGVRYGPSPRGCNATYHMDKALTDYLVGAMSAVTVGFDRLGYPVISQVDALDVSWDQQARVPAEARWSSIRARRPLHEWEDIYKGNSVLREVCNKYRENPDKVVEVEEYSDMDSDEGTRAVFLRIDGVVWDKPLEVTANPFYFMVDGFKQPYLPTDIATYFGLPSVRYAISQAEMMLPSQIALWNVDRRIRDTIKAGSPYWDVVREAYTDEEIDKFEDGDIGAILMRKDPNLPPAQRVEGLEISQSLMAYQGLKEKDFVADSGADPYALGNTVQGTQYAAEVNAIQGAAGLTPGAVAKAHSAQWERITTKFLGAAALYDDMPIRIKYDEVTLEFDATDPIKDYIQPDAKVIVREDSMAYQPQDRRMAQALSELQVAQQMGQYFPNALQEAYKRFLDTAGVKDTTKWLEVPQQSLAMPDNGMASAQAAGIA